MFTALEIIEIFDKCFTVAEANQCRDIFKSVLTEQPTMYFKLMERCYTNCITKLIEK